MFFKTLSAGISHLGFVQPAAALEAITSHAMPSLLPFYYQVVRTTKQGITSQLTAPPFKFV